MSLAFDVGQCCEVFVALWNVKTWVATRIWVAALQHIADKWMAFEGQSCTIYAQTRKPYMYISGWPLSTTF